MSNCGCHQISADRKILIIALALNVTMFAIGLLAGIIAQSTGLIADALDMLADASVYTFSLLAIGRGMRFKSTIAMINGSLLLIISIGVLIEIGRRALLGSSPESTMMVAIACISLAVNGIVLHLMNRFRDNEVHLRATWICTRADIIANMGVIISGVLVALTRSRYPDLIIGFAICLYVIKEAFIILGDARKGLNVTDHSVA